MCELTTMKKVAKQITEIEISVADKWNKLNINKDWMEVVSIEEFIFNEIRSEFQKYNCLRQTNPSNKQEYRQMYDWWIRELRQGKFFKLEHVYLRHDFKTISTKQMALNRQLEEMNKVFDLLKGESQILDLLNVGLTNRIEHLFN